MKYSLAVSRAVGPREIARYGRKKPLSRVNVREIHANTRIFLAAFTRSFPPGCVCVCVCVCVCCVYMCIVYTTTVLSDVERRSAFRRTLYTVVCVFVQYVCV